MSSDIEGRFVARKQGDMWAVANEADGVIVVDKIKSEDHAVLGAYYFEMGSAFGRRQSLTTITTLQADLDSAREALRIADSWLERWARHVANCQGGHLCTCGLTRVLFDIRTTLTNLEAQKES